MGPFEILLLTVLAIDILLNIITEVKRNKRLNAIEKDLIMLKSGVKFNLNGAIL